tara:strand:+ start:830 stop:1288 length:459 start_codon:yes stop_codon:yes gene_type:complete
MVEQDIRFYHLHRQSVAQALPALLSKAWTVGNRIVVKCRDDAESEALTKELWTFSKTIFLPHGNKKDGYDAEQPIWLTAQEENPNQANMLLVTSPPEGELPQDFSLGCIMFNGADEVELQAARACWRRMKDSGKANLSYFQQSEQGGWSKKA